MLNRKDMKRKWSQIPHNLGYFQKKQNRMPYDDTQVKSDPEIEMPKKDNQLR